MFTQQLLIIASYLTAHLSTASCIHGTSLLPRAELPGGTVKVSNFGYTGLQGPLNWAGISPENSACATSNLQSPINIDDTIALAAEAPQVDIPNVEAAEFENLGSTVEVIVNGTTTLAGAQFSLKQFHFHTPSEHRIAEEYYPLEIHMVHEAADGSGAIVVISLIFQLSEDGTTSTALLDAITENLESIRTPGTVTETAALNFTEVVNHIQTTPLFQYTGSLTTPPCAEGLTFLIIQQPLPLSVKTFNAIKSVVKFNSRYTQNTLGEQNLISVAASALGCEATGAANETAAVISEDAVAAPTEMPTAGAPPPADHVAVVEPPPNHAVVAPEAETTTMAHPAAATTTTAHPAAEAVNSEADQGCILGAC